VQAACTETADETFKAYMTIRPKDGSGAGSDGGAGAATPARLPVPDASDDEDGSVLITPAGPGGGGGDHVPSPTLDMGTSLSNGGRTQAA
jgi:hypothetical protein